MTSSASKLQLAIQDTVSLTKEERIRQFGLNCGDDLDWGTNWAPGGDYTKILTFQNTTTQNIKITYELPATRYFYMKFPEPITLAPGVSRSVSVSFRPVELKEYTDYISVATTVGPGGPIKDGVFQIPVRASLPKLSAHIPSSLHFGSIVTHEVNRLKVPIKNTGGTKAYFVWSLATAPSEPKAPLTIEPMTGCIEPGDECMVTVSICPETAFTLDTQIKCILADAPLNPCQSASERIPESILALINNSGLTSRVSDSGSSSENPRTIINHTVRVTARITYPYVELSQRTVDFGLILADTTQEISITLENRTDATTSWQLVHVDKGGVSPFKAHPTRGSLAAHGKVTVTFTFSPRTSNSEFAEHYELRVPGHRIKPPTIEVAGRSCGPSVRLSTWSVDFGDVSLASLTTKSATRSVAKEVVIFNASSKPVYFSFPQMEGLSSVDTSFAITAPPSSLIPGGLSRPPSAPFTITPPSGVIPPFVSTTVVVRFLPTLPINYYQRVYCCVLHQQPLFLDLLGSAYTDKLRPAPFSQRQVDAARTRAAIEPALRRLDPSQVLALQNGPMREFLLPAIKMLPPPSAASLATQAALAAQQEQLSARHLELEQARKDAEVRDAQATLDLVAAHSYGAKKASALHAARHSLAMKRIPTASGPLVCTVRFCGDMGPRGQTTLACLEFPGLFEQSLQTPDESPVAEATLSVKYLDFGTLSMDQPCQVREVGVTNHTNAKITAVWLLPSIESVNAAAQLLEFGTRPGSAQSANGSMEHVSNPPFCVSPGAADIAPGETFVFRIQCRPSACGPSSAGLFQNLQCLTYFKSQRTFRLVDAASFAPPLMLNLPALAYVHSPMRNARFVANVQLSNARAELPAVVPGGKSYSTFTLSNASGSPAFFRFTNEGGRSSNGFHVSPWMGCIPPNSHVVLTVEFDSSKVSAAVDQEEGSANQLTMASALALIEEGGGAETTLPASGMFQHTFSCVLNGSSEDMLSLAVMARVERPLFEIENGGSIYFKPTSLGMESKRTVAIRNLSRVPLQFRWELDEGSQVEWGREIFANPRYGVIAGNRTVTIEFTFSPQRVGKYEFALRCFGSAYPLPFEVLDTSSPDEIGASESTMRKTLLKQATTSFVVRPRGSCDAEDGEIDLDLSSIPTESVSLSSSASLASSQVISPEMCAIYRCLKGAHTSGIAYSPVLGSPQQMNEVASVALCHALCSHAALQFVPNKLELGNLPLNLPAVASFEIKNASDVAITYTLNWEEIISAEQPRSIVRKGSSIPATVVLSPKSGELPARSSRKVSVQVTPLVAAKFIFSVKCAFAAAGQCGSNAVAPQSLVIEAAGTVPALRVTDAWIEAPRVWSSAFGQRVVGLVGEEPDGVRLYDPSTFEGRECAWRQLQVDRLNACLIRHVLGNTDHVQLEKSGNAPLTLQQAIAVYPTVVFNLGSHTASQLGLSLALRKSSVSELIGNSGAQVSHAEHATTSTVTHAQEDAENTVVLPGGIRAPRRSPSNVKSETSKVITSSRGKDSLPGTSTNPDAIIGVDVEQGAGLAYALQQHGTVSGVGSLGLPVNAPGFSAAFIRITNVSVLPAQWTLESPVEDDAGLEHWGDPGNPDVDQRSEHVLRDMQVFQVHPRSGNLKPGESCVIQLTYLHRAAGIHETSFLFRYTESAPTVWKLVGETRMPALTSPLIALVNYAKLIAPTSQLANSPGAVATLATSIVSHMEKSLGLPLSTAPQCWPHSALLSIPGSITPSAPKFATNHLSVSYYPRSLLPILLSSSPKAPTLLTGAPKIQLSTSARSAPVYHIWLDPVPLGLSLPAESDPAGTVVDDAPVQYIRLINDSVHWLAFAVRHEPLQASANAYDGSQVFSIDRRDMIGLVPPGAAFPLRVRFRPLELRCYALMLAIDIVAVKPRSLNDREWHLEDIDSLAQLRRTIFDPDTGVVRRMPTQMFLVHGRAAASTNKKMAMLLPEKTLLTMAVGPVTSEYLAMAHAATEDVLLKGDIACTSASQDTSSAEAVHRTYAVPDVSSPRPLSIYATSPWTAQGWHDSLLPNCSQLPAQPQFPGKFASLSVSTLSLGAVEPSSMVQRIVALYNHSKKHSVSFTWRNQAYGAITSTHVQDQYAGKLLTPDEEALLAAPPHESLPSISVQPSHGTIPPGGRAVLRVTFMSPTKDSVYVRETIVCDVQLLAEQSSKSLTHGQLQHAPAQGRNETNLADSEARRSVVDHLTKSRQRQIEITAAEQQFKELWAKVYQSPQNAPDSNAYWTSPRLSHDVQAEIAEMALAQPDDLLLDLEQERLAAETGSLQVVRLPAGGFLQPLEWERAALRRASTESLLALNSAINAAASLLAGPQQALSTSTSSSVGTNVAIAVSQLLAVRGEDIYAELQKRKHLTLSLTVRAECLTYERLPVFKQANCISSVTVAAERELSSDDNAQIELVDSVPIPGQQHLQLSSARSVEADDRTLETALKLVESALMRTALANEKIRKHGEGLAQRLAALTHAASNQQLNFSLGEPENLILVHSDDVSSVPSASPALNESSVAVDVTARFTSIATPVLSDMVMGLIEEVSRESANANQASASKRVLGVVSPAEAGSRK